MKYALLIITYFIPMILLGLLAVVPFFDGSTAGSMIVWPIGVLALCYLIYFGY